MNISISILKKAFKSKLQKKLLQESFSALNKISNDIPPQTGYMVITQGPHGRRRSITSRLYANSKGQGAFLGMLKVESDARPPVFTSAEECSGRALDLQATQVSMVQDHLKELGHWPVSKK